MISGMLVRLFARTPMRWMMGIGLMLVLGVLTHGWLIGYGGDAAGLGTTNEWDVVFGALTQSAVATLIIPMYFLYLVSDLVTADLEETISLTVTRWSSRLVWFTGHVLTLSLGAAFFVSLITMVLWMVGFLYGIPFDGSWSFYVHHGGLYEATAFHSSLPNPLLDRSPLFTFIVLFALYWGTLVALGTLVISLSVMFRNAWYAWTVGSLLCVATYVVWKEWTVVLRFMPTAQMMLLPHYEITRLKLFKSFTLFESWFYLAGFFALAYTSGAWRVRGMDLSKS